MVKITPLYTLNEMILEEEAQQVAQRGLLIQGQSPLAFVAGPSERMVQFASPEEMFEWIESAKKSGMKFRKN